MTLTWWVSKLAIDEMSFSCDQKVPNLLPSVNLVVLPKLILACKEFGDRRRHLQQLHFDIGLICDGTARHPHAASRTLLEYLLFKPWPGCMKDEDGFISFVKSFSVCRQLQPPTISDCYKV